MIINLGRAGAERALLGTLQGCEHLWHTTEGTDCKILCRVSPSTSVDAMGTVSFVAVYTVRSKIGQSPRSDDNTGIG
jgi:hypothetical protein